jgi:hypothetical protein
MQEPLEVIFYFLKKAGPMRNVHNEKVRERKRRYIKMPHIGRAAFSRPAAVRVCKLLYFGCSPSLLFYASPRERKKALFTYTSRGRGDPYTHTHTRRCNFPPAHKRKKGKIPFEPIENCPTTEPPRRLR